MVQNTERPSQFFTRWGRLILKYRRLFLGLTALSALISGWLIATRTTVDMGIESFTDKSSKTNSILKEFRKEFGRDDVWVIAAEGEVFSREYLESLERLHRELETSL